MHNPDSLSLEGSPDRELDLLAEVEKDRGVPISNHVKRTALDERFVSQALQEEDSVNVLALAVAAIEAGARRPTPATPKERVIESDRNLAALARIIATQAGQDPGVVAFRRDVLRGKLIRPHRLDAWIRRKAREDGEPTRWIDIPTGAKRIPQDPSELDLAELGPGENVRFSYRLLQYETGDGSTQSLRVARGGTLENLRLVAKGLEQRFSWNPALAVRFILTDEPTSPLRAKVTRSIKLPFPARSRITLDVSLRVTPDEVKELYEQARKDLGLPTVATRVKTISEKHAELAVSAAQHASGYRWEDVMRIWNKQQPAWRYHDAKRFTRDARRAYRRITGERLHWEGERS